jgi:hypothetical protein
MQSLQLQLKNGQKATKNHILKAFFLAFVGFKSVRFTRGHEQVTIWL